MITALGITKMSSAYVCACALMGAPHRGIRKYAQLHQCWHCSCRHSDLCRKPRKCEPDYLAHALRSPVDPVM